ncbi:hypothetical protein L484_007277 [Morus notabilis]|uniref:Uncharacterized protein n=1 Tax=Morus notabilis TaxID=981085 RepID=W9QZA0_9ROSA|nr:hypothetical protein L484_007277 [Morus notabilis]
MERKLEPHALEIWARLGSVILGQSVRSTRVRFGNRVRSFGRCWNEVVRREARGERRGGRREARTAEERRD